MTQNYAVMIDHTLLKAESTKDQVEKSTLAQVSFMKESSTDLLQYV